jgi:rod shape-determining protein MreC
LHQLTLEVIGPFQKIISRASVSAGRLKSDYFELWAIRDENKRLRSLLNNYQEQLDEYREAYAVYLHLQRQLDFKKKETFPSLTARVIAKDPAFWFKTIIVDLGKNDGVVEGMVALNDKGVVGQVINVSANYAKILLANAPSSAIDAMVQKNRVRGILKGTGERGYVLNYVLKNSDVAVGDRIVTAGIGGVFSSGIPLGVVSAVRKKRRGMFLEVEVTPSVDFQKLEILFINLSEGQKIRGEMNLPGSQ